MLAVDEVLSLARVSPSIRVSRLVAAADCSEATLRNWRTNPPRPPKTAFEVSEKLLHVIETEDPDFRLPVSVSANLQLMRMRRRIEERRYPDNRSQFMRTYEMDLDRWAEISRKKEGFKLRDWDTVLCCFYFQFNQMYCKDDGGRSFRSDTERWDQFTQHVSLMADAGMREAESSRMGALFRLIKVSLLWRRIHPSWDRLSQTENPSDRQRASDREIFMQASAHMAKYNLYEETANLSRELPDFAPLVFNSIAVASRLGETDRFQGLWKRLRETDSRFDRTWFETAYYHHGSGAQHSKSVFAARFQRWVDADFANFIGWLGHGGEEESHPDVSRGGANTPRAR